MSIATESRVRVIMADFANNDAAGKLNVLGTAFSMMMQAAPGMWPPFNLAVVIDVPAKCANEDYALTVELKDLTTGKLFQVAQGAQLEPMRVQQAVSVPALALPPGLKAPTDAMVQHSMVLSFPQGLPFNAGSTYEWQVQIDGKTRHDWATRFHALAPVAGPVFGGPTNSLLIPGVPPSR